MILSPISQAQHNGLRNALEIDLRLQSEECLREGGKGVKEVDDLPWKGGGEGKEFECLRNELRKMAPVNGRAVLVFQNKCGCAVAKMEGWTQESEVSWFYKF
ncbi:hypothetical protein AgCh_032507 [Apium graveolens]